MLSTVYTGRKYWNAAIREINGFDQNDAVYNERFNLINQSTEIAQGLVADVVAESYIKEASIFSSSSGNSINLGLMSSSYVAATRTLTAVMNADFTSNSVGGFIVMIIGDNFYSGSIKTVVNTTTVILETPASASELPVSNVGFFDFVSMKFGLPIGSSVSLRDLRMLRYGMQLKMQFRSSITSQVYPKSAESFAIWKSSAQDNLNSIVWNLIGVDVAFKNGNNISSLGTLYLRYVALPELTLSDTDGIDLLDGSLVQIGIMVLRSLIQKNLKLPITIDRQQIVDEVMAIYAGQGKQANKEVIKQKLGMLL